MLSPDVDPAGPARHGGVQRLPLLRGVLPGVSGDGEPVGVREGRPRLPRQPLPQLRRVPLRVPVRPAARVRHQRAADAGRSAAGIVRGVLLAGVAGRRLPGSQLVKSWAAGCRFERRADRVGAGLRRRSVAGAAGGDFYRVVPHDVMVGLFGLAGVFALRCVSRSAVGGAARSFVASGFSRTAERPAKAGRYAQALRDALTLRHLHGGGVDCTDGGGTAVAVAPLLSPSDDVRLRAVLRVHERRGPLSRRFRLARAVRLR